MCACACLYARVCVRLTDVTLVFRLLRKPLTSCLGTDRLQGTISRVSRTLDLGTLTRSSPSRAEGTPDVSSRPAVGSGQ